MLKGPLKKNGSAPVSLCISHYVFSCFALLEKFRLADTQPSGDVFVLREDDRCCRLFICRLSTELFFLVAFSSSLDNGPAQSSLVHAKTV